MNRFRPLVLFVLAVVCLSACSNQTDTASATVMDGVVVQITADAGQELNPSLSPDGSSVGFDKLTAPGNSDIYVVKGGAAAVNLTADSKGNDIQPAFSPDGQRIAFRSARDGGGIFVMSASGGAATKVIGEGFNPSWTPDGKQLLYGTTSGGNTPYNAPSNDVVWIVNIESREKKQVSQGYAVHPRMSPHGQRVAVWAQFSGEGRVGAQRDIWTMKPDGSDLVAVTNDKAVDWSPAWSPDGKFLYFASDRDGTMKIWRFGIDENTGKTSGDAEVVSKDGGAPVRGEISFATNGRMTYMDASSNRSLLKANFDSSSGTLQGAATAVTDASISPTDFNISPDGKSVVFTTGDNKQEDIYVIQSDGTGLKQLTNDPYRDRSARWTPDGKTIVFRSDRPVEGSMGNYQYYTINPEGSVLRRITSTEGTNSSGTFSTPDGKKVVFAPNFRTGGTELYLMNPDGTDSQKIASTSGVYSDFVWSPDSKRLAFRETKGSTGQAFIYTLSGKVDPLPAMNFAPFSWSADGKTIAGNQVFSDKPAVTVLLDLAAMKYETITDAGSAPELLKDGKRILITGAGTKVLLLDRSTKSAQELISGKFPDTLVASMSKDNKAIFYLLSKLESDIYQLGK